MVDPHLMLLLMQLLGKRYLVWDKAANIEFIKASKKRVTAIIAISHEDLKEIKDNTDNGDKYFSNFIIAIRDEDNELVAKIKKTIYIKKKSAHS